MTRCVVLAVQHAMDLIGLGFDPGGHGCDDDVRMREQGSYIPLNRRQISAPFRQVRGPLPNAAE